MEWIELTKPHMVMLTSADQLVSRALSYTR